MKCSITAAGSSDVNSYTASDPTLRVIQNEETKEQVVFGMGQLHLDVAAAYVKARTGVQIHWKKPRVPYRETITSSAEAQGKSLAQTVREDAESLMRRMTNW